METMTSDPAASDEAPTVDASGVGRTMTRLTGHLSIIDGFALCALGLLPIALVPGFLFPTHLRLAIAFSALPLGSFLLARAAVRERRLPAIAGLVFVGFVASAAWGTDQWAVSLYGSVNYELSALTLLVAFGWWAIGRELSAPARRALPIVLTVGAGVNLALGLLQVVFDPTVGIYRSFEGRPNGLMSNPVYFASFVGGLWAYWFVRATRRVSGASIALLALLATLTFGLGLSGGRTAALIVLATICAALTLRPSRYRVILTSGAASLVGFMAGVLTLGFAATEQSERLSRPSQGFDLRLDVWRMSLRAWAERPFTGWGPNPYFHETNTRISEATVREFGRLQWPDPHNVLVLVLVTGGIVGIVVLAAFVWTGLRGRIDYPLVALAAAVVASWMLQPVVVTGWPVAFAAFGAAVRNPIAPDTTAIERRTGAAIRAMVAVGVVFGLSIAAWSVQFRAALRDPDPSHVEARASVLLHDPEVLERVAQAYIQSPATGAELDRHFQEAEVFAARAVDLGSNPEHWALLVEANLHQEDWASAFTAAQAWADDWPNDPAAHQVLAAVAAIVGDDDAASTAHAKFCRLVGCDENGDPSG